MRPARTVPVKKLMLFEGVQQGKMLIRIARRQVWFADPQGRISSTDQCDELGEHRDDGCERRSGMEDVR